MNWEEGRGESGYFKLKLLESKKMLFDLYLLKYPEGSSILPHKDAVEFGRHFRVNLILKKATGGEFLCGHKILSLGRLQIFRPDLNTHEVTLVTKGTRYVLSFGFVLKNKSKPCVSIKNTKPFWF